MSAWTFPIKGGRRLPIDPRFVMVLSLDENGDPIPISGGGSLPAGAATEAMQARELAMGFGEGGCVFVKGGDPAATGNFYGFIVFNDATITAVTAGASVDGAENLEGMTVYAGFQALLPFTSIEISSGVIQLLKLPA